MLERAAASALGGPAFWAMTVPCKKFNDTTQPDRLCRDAKNILKIYQRNKEGIVQ